MSRDEKLQRNRERMSAHRLADPENARDIRLRCHFGITLAEYKAMLTAQGGACAICGTTEPRGKGDFHVDHDHACCSGRRSCGKCIRGLLCTRCNSGLGMFDDNPDRVAEALVYLEKRNGM